MSRQGGRRKGPTGGLFGLIGSGVGMAAEYHEHRKQQKQARTDEARNGNADETAEGPSSRSLPEQPRSDQPPAYDDIAEISERTLDSGNPVSDEKKITDPDDLTDVSDSDDDDESIEDDEEMWELDEALTPHDNDNEGLPSYDESEASQQPVEELVRDVLSTSQPLQATSSGTPFEREPLPCPVIIPQRRPRKKARGFIRAYAPVLDGCGIDQTTFLSFLKNFHKSSKSSPIFPAIQIAAGIAGMAPSVIAMAVCTAAQIAAGVGAELQTRGRTNQFLDRMNDELFKPAGLYAMIVRYKSDADMEQNAATRSLLSNLIQAENVDLSTNQVIAKYARTASDQAESSGSRSIGDRMKQLRLASDTTRGTVMLPESAPLIFPDIDDKVAKEGPETFKDKTKDAKKFLADYLDRRAQVEYANKDPKSTLTVPESERAFRSQLADPNHAMHSGGLVALLSGGKLTPRMHQRERRIERNLRRDTRRVANGREPRRRRYGEEYYNELQTRVGERTAHGTKVEDRRRGSRGIDAAEGSSSASPFSGYSRGQGGRRGGRRGGRGGAVGAVKRIMREDVLYLMIVNMPSEAELAEAKAELARG